MGQWGSVLATCYWIKPVLFYGVNWKTLTGKKGICRCKWTKIVLIILKRKDRDRGWKKSELVNRDRVKENERERDGKLRKLIREIERERERGYYDIWKDIYIEKERER